MNLHIELADIRHASCYPDYFHACRAAACEHYADAGDSAAVFFQRVLDNAAGRHLPPGYVPSLTWFALDELGCIVGAIRLRLGTTPFIFDECGHIGYEVLPAARGQGIAGRLLAHVQSYGTVQLDGGWIITCAANNPASQRTISGRGGRLLDIRPQGAGEPDLLRYHLAAQSQKSV